MCIGIYFVDKEVVQHCKVSVKCGMWQGLRQVETNSRNLTADFDRSHCWVTGCPGKLQECHHITSHLPTFFPSGDKITFNYIKIHINRQARMHLVLFLQMDKLPNSSSIDKRGPSKMSQDGKWYILAYQGHGGILVCGITGTVSKPKIPIFQFTLRPRHDTQQKE